MNDFISFIFSISCFFLSSNVQNISRKNHKSVDVNFNSVKKILSALLILPKHLKFRLIRVKIYSCHPFFSLRIDYVKIRVELLKRDLSFKMAGRGFRTGLF
jgi:hypothetical protein